MDKNIQQELVNLTLQIVIMIWAIEPISSVWWNGVYRYR